MLITPRELFENWNVFPNSVLHVGAHLGEESSLYDEVEWFPVIWIEAQPSLIQELLSKLDPQKNQIIEAAIWDVSGLSMPLNIASNSQSTSLLDFGTHARSYPEIINIESIMVQTKRLDDIFQSSKLANFINLDIQGVELNALKSLGELILEVDYIYMEVNWREVYKGCSRVWEIDKFLEHFGFFRATTRWYLRPGWGDALYLKKEIKSQSVKQKIKNLQSASRFYYPQAIALGRKLFIFKFLRRMKKRNDT
jgi:FkbM family methyltransferase